jgi:hypothetical protein
MLPLITSFKTLPMRSAPLLTVALGMIACTHFGNENAGCFKDSTPAKDLMKNIPITPVVNSKKTEVNTGPELPFYKDVLDSKRLFW